MKPVKRYISILFCDLVGSTALSELLEPEDYLYILKAYHATVAQEIQIQYGYVAQFLGDGVLAYFGYPTAYSKTEYRAINAGLKVCESVQALNGRLKNFYHVDIAVRVGVHSGKVVIAECGIGHKRERLALGEAPNLASRIMSRAVANQVVVSETTYAEAKDQFEFESLGAYKIRGHSEDMTLFSPLG